MQKKSLHCWVAIGCERQRKDAGSPNENFFSQPDFDNHIYTLLFAVVFAKKNFSPLPILCNLQIAVNLCGYWMQKYY